MNKKIILTCSLLLCLSFSIFATKRTMPIDMILMIDKSLSMEEPGKFESLKKWVLENLINQMLIKGDWISIYQFYEAPEKLLSINLQNKNDKQKIIDTINNIQPNGKFTDIGKALDKIDDAVNQRGKNDRYKVLLIITDLEQDAPITSKYAGKQKKFTSPYLVESRIIKHDNWYEITLDMSIQERVVKTTKELFSEMENNENIDRSHSDEKEALIKKNSK